MPYMCRSRVNLRIGRVLHIDRLPVLIPGHFCLEGNRVTNVTEAEGRGEMLSLQSAL